MGKLQSSWNKSKINVNLTLRKIKFIDDLMCKVKNIISPFSYIKQYSFLQNMFSSSLGSIFIHVAKHLYVSLL